MISGRQLLALPAAAALGALAVVSSVLGFGVSGTIFAGLPRPWADYAGFGVVGIPLGFAYAQLLSHSVRHWTVQKMAARSPARLVSVTLSFAAFYAVAQSWALRTGFDAHNTERDEPIIILLGQPVLTMMTCAGVCAGLTALLVTRPHFLAGRFLLSCSLGAGVVLLWFMQFHSIDEMLRQTQHPDQWAFNWNVQATTDSVFFLLLPCWLPITTFIALWPFKDRPFRGDVFLPQTAATKANGRALTSWGGWPK